MSAKSSQEDLRPTLWRTCRALANRRRLRVLQSLLDGAPRTVSEVAALNQLSEVSASQCLRTLNARGVLRVRRVSRWVTYRIGHDPSVPETKSLVRALRRQLRGGDQALEATFRNVTAFTHARRMDIMRALARRDDLTLESLRCATGISASALFRHLHKLDGRGLVRKVDGRYSCATPGSLLLRILVRLIQAN